MTNSIGVIYPPMPGSYAPGVQAEAAKANAIGCDISFYQDDSTTPARIDFGKMREAGADFVIIRASQADYTDRDFYRNWQAAREAGLLRGAYHFLTWDVSPDVQASHFAGLIQTDPPELGGFADFEWWSSNIPDNCKDTLYAFAERYKKIVGKLPGIYTAPGFWNQYGSDDPYWAGLPLWVAHWGVSQPAPMKPWGDKWVFWQTTNKGDGLKYGVESKNLDMDYFNGDRAALLAYAGKADPVQPGADCQAQIDALTDRVSKIEQWIRLYS